MCVVFNDNEGACELCEECAECNELVQWLRLKMQEAGIL